MELLKKHFDTALESPDGVKKLRELILTLAMQGKLVEQDPADQPASELLNDIQAEKERLIDEGKIKKQKPLPEIKPEEIPYKVPEIWVWTRLGLLIFSAKDGPHYSPKYTTEGVPFISTRNISSLGINFSNAKYISYEDNQEISKRCKPEKWDVLYTKGGTTGIARVNTYDIDFNVWVHVAVLKKPSNIDAFFLQNVLNSPHCYKQSQNLTHGAGNQDLGLTRMVNITIPLPPLAEQKRIVEKIDQLMALCDKLEARRKSREEKRLAVHTSVINRLLSASEGTDFNSSWQFITQHFSELYSVKENVTELKKAILTLAMQGKLVRQDSADQPSSELLKEIKAEKERLITEGKIKKQKPLPEIKPEEIPYEIPGSWEWVRLGEIGESQTGTTPSKKEPENFGNYIPFIGPGNIKNGVINYKGDGLSEKGLEKGRLIKSNSVLMVCIGGSIGKHAINKIDVSCNQQLNTITPILSEVEYLFYTMGNYYFQDEVISNAGGSATPIINKNKWSAILIPLPPLAEQKRIVEKIDQLMALCGRLEEQIDLSTKKQTELFDSILAKV